MKKIPKIILLAISAGICFMGFAEINALWSIAVHSRSVDMWSWAGLKESFSLFMFGAIICLVFGTPFLLLIDKYFHQLRIRYVYVLGGVIAAWVAWLVIAGPLFTPRLWLHPERWNWPYSGIIAGMGFATGTVFTSLLRGWEHCKKGREPLHENSTRDRLNI